MAATTFIKVETWQYEATHRRKPRGRGLWWFEIHTSNGSGTYRVTHTSHEGMYSEALRAAKRKALKSKPMLVRVAVLP